MPKIKISRYNPEVDNEPILKEYEVPQIEQGTVLEALQYVQEEIDSTLLFSYGCRYMVCGKCAVKINGESRLACATPLQEGMILEPIDNLPVIRDLAIDRTGLMESFRKNNIVLSPREGSEIAIQPTEFFQLSRCIECLSCFSVCPIIDCSAESDGPFFRVKLAELYYDVRDEKERLAQLESFNNCTACQACTTYCPIQIDLAELVEGAQKRHSKPST
jgi:succinate dehydrogenase/fumarate reductase iron-sulfur protein